MEEEEALEEEEAVVDLVEEVEEEADEEVLEEAVEEEDFKLMLQLWERCTRRRIVLEY